MKTTATLQALPRLIFFGEIFALIMTFGINVFSYCFDVVWLAPAIVSIIGLVSVDRKNAETDPADFRVSKLLLRI